MPKLQNMIPHMALGHIYTSNISKLHSRQDEIPQPHNMWIDQSNKQTRLSLIP